MQVPAASASLTLLLVCAFALQSASALKCYDCLSVALPQCEDDNKFKEFEDQPCGSDENLCSVLTLSDPEGKVIVSRQCSRGTSEAADLVRILEAQVQLKLTMQRFDTCEGDLCNASPSASAGAPANAGSALPLLSALFALVAAIARFSATPQGVA